MNRTLRSTREHRKQNGANGVIRGLQDRNRELVSTAKQVHLTQLAFYEHMRQTTHKLQSDLVLYNKTIFVKPKANPWR